MAKEGSAAEILRVRAQAHLPGPRKAFSLISSINCPKITILQQKKKMFIVYLNPFLGTQQPLLNPQWAQIIELCKKWENRPEFEVNPSFFEKPPFPQNFRSRNPHFDVLKWYLVSTTGHLLYWWNWRNWRTFLPCGTTDPRWRVAVLFKWPAAWAISLRNHGDSLLWSPAGLRYRIPFNF